MFFSSCASQCLGLVILQAGSKCFILQLIRQTLAERLTCPRVVRESQVAANNVLEQPLAGLLGQLDHHLAQDHGHVGEPVVSLADVVQTSLIQEDLLEDEGGHGLAQLRSRLHNPQQRGIISVVSRKLITSCSSVLTRAPMTPREVRRRYSKGLVLETVWRKG